MSQIVLPELGDGIAKATVVCWHVKVGDRVRVDDDVVEVVTDKATFNVSSTCEGVVKTLHCTEGQDAQVGQVLVEVM